ncbi:potassium-transporting ATPase subunit KdpC [Pantoea sp. MBD-2R]|uniref:potassium-transporting ATPase subunit KdpC n=1 Tax=Pantoea sp. MBD-2R TaxID=3141540 RepID=UPI003182DC44
MSQLRPAFVVLILLTLITGVLYPFLATTLGQSWFAQQAGGSLIEDRGQIRGSRLLGQAFSEEKYFHGRPSATADLPYNPMASGGSNLAASNPALDKAVAERVAQLRAENPQATAAIPVDLLTSSASGLDYGISPEAALWQLPRVARARDLPAEQVRRLINANTHQPPLRFLGQPWVNVLELNLALDAMQEE